MSIRNRTAYSFRSAIGDIGASHKKITEILGGRSLVTDTASAFAFTRWSKLCKAAGSKPVFGIELAVSANIHVKKPTHDYWTFIAQESLRPLNDLLMLATSQFRYVPLLTVEQANKAAGVHKIMGYRTDFSLADLNSAYVALAPSLAVGQYRKAKELGARFVAASDNRYLEPDDLTLYQVSLGRFSSIQSYPQHLLTDAEWRAAGPWNEAEAAEAIETRDALLEGCSAAQITGSILTPAKPTSLKELCLEGAVRVGCNLSDPVYAERLDRELDLITSKGFEDYFYIISDLCKFARRKMIVGPARGSSCGSLVCYLLNITTVDPIKYGLIFERFIDINRSDLPDIDIDFSDTKRQLVFDYMAKKYGKEHVARLGTVSLFRARSALQDTAVALEIPRYEIEKVTDVLIERQEGDARALQTTEDTLTQTPAGRKLISKFPEIMIATRMEGQPKNNSQHAAGVILTDRPVIDYVSVDARTGATHCDKKDAEDLGLLKIDALGLTQLAIFEDALELAGLPVKTLETVPLNDPAAFAILNQRKYSGIFQFNGAALQSITNQVIVKELNDIISITALGRPGPLHSGGAASWVKIKNGEERMTFPHPLFAKQLSETLGIIIYQEQVMQICREIGDMSWTDTISIRKAMGKTMGKEFFDQYGEKWKAGAIAKGVEPNVATKAWNDLVEFGSYAFNKSHSVAYGLVSYYCCWLKAHYPVEFAAATMSHTDTPDLQIKLLREMEAEGVTYIPVDIELSGANWTVGVKNGAKHLVGPLSSVIGIGPKTVMQILSARARNEPIPERAAKMFQNPQTNIDSLYPISARLQEILPNPRERNIFTSPTNIIDVQITGDEYDVMVFCVIKHINPKEETIGNNDPAMSLGLWLSDDTDTIYAKVNSGKPYEDWAIPIIERARTGKAIYAIKGTVPQTFRMIKIKQVKYLGDLDKKIPEEPFPASTEGVST